MHQTSGQKESNRNTKTKGGFHMLKLMKKRMKNEKGLTLIEVLAVVVILAIISAIAIPAIGNIIDNSRAKAQISDAMNVMSAANIYFAENLTGVGEGGTSAPITEVTGATLVSEGYLESFGKITGVTVKKVAGGNTIDFTVSGGVKIDNSTGLTLEKLSNATVKNGEIITDGTVTTGS